MTSSLRNYQLEAVEKCVSFHKKKKNSQLMVLPTGTGKTRTFCAIIKELNYKTLIISHTSQLRKQIEIECKKHCPDQKVISKTIQSCKSKAALQEIDSYKFDMLIIDEAHHAATDSYQNIIKYFINGRKLVLGCTATPFRLDKQSIDHIFPNLICKKTILEMVESGFLCDIKGYRVRTNLNLDDVHCFKGDYNIRQLSSIVNSVNRNNIILSTYKQILLGKKTLIFCVDIAHCEEVANLFTEHKISAQSIHGRLHKDEQFTRLRNFKDSITTVLTTCQILTEGFDEPSVEALMICRPTKSAGLYIQMVGRGLRTFPGKKHCEIVELTDNAHDICSFESLITEKTIEKFFAKTEGITSLKKLKELIEIQEEDIVIEEKNFLTKWDKKHISPFQKKYMYDHNIPFIEPISYEIADLIISNYQNREKYGFDNKKN